MRSIPLCSNEVRVNCHLLLGSFTTNTMCAPSRSAVTRCGSTAAFPWRASPQIQHALHPTPQGRRGAGLLPPSLEELRHKYNAHSITDPQGKRGTSRLLPSPSELRHKYNVRSSLIRKDDEVRVDWSINLRAASQAQRLFRVKNKFHSKTNTSIFRDKSSSDKS